MLEEQHNPVADTRAVVCAGDARFTVLTPALLRLEWSPGGLFEDRRSLLFLNRRLDVPKFTTSRAGSWLTIETDQLKLRYREGRGRFTKEDLSVELAVNGQRVVWRPGKRARGNLRGTARTLDRVDGRCKLEPGLLARDGWALVDDSERALFDEGGWPQPRAQTEALDWYFFGHGHAYAACLRDFTRVAGRVPLPPRFVFGSWWSRYWAYSDEELKRLVAEFRAHDVPLDVLVLDMDWHLDGWSGYTWNPKCFPDPERFLSWAHEHGLKVPLNIHPGFEIEAHEERYAEVAGAVDRDAGDGEPIPFDLTDRRFARAYCEHLLRPREDEGVDFWWLDMPGQWSGSGMAGVDVLWWLNHLHWTDMARSRAREDKRPLIFSRWGGLGNHRYPIGFSGDTFNTWASLAFQPYMTATAGNVCFGYWSHDIGGHQPGPVEPELYVRWIQWGAFSPVLRTHAADHEAAERRIWTLPDEHFRAARQAFHLRYELIPYIYTAARECYDTALPLCRPLYYEWPGLEEAYRHPREYLFGDQMLVAPVTVPATPTTGRACVRVWLPPGSWTHWFNGETYAGPGEITLDVPLDEIPVFVRAGGIIPTGPKMSRTNEKPLDPLTVHVFPGDAGELRLYEDDGKSLGYQRGDCAWTPMAHRCVGETRRINIGPTRGSYHGMSVARGYEVRLHNTRPAGQMAVNGTPLPPATRENGSGWWYDARTQGLCIRLLPRPVTEPIEITVTPKRAG